MPVCHVACSLMSFFFITSWSRHHGIYDSPYKQIPAPGLQFLTSIRVFVIGVSRTHKSRDNCFWENDPLQVPAAFWNRMYDRFRDIVSEFEKTHFDFLATRRCAKYFKTTRSLLKKEKRKKKWKIFILRRPRSQSQFWFHWFNEKKKIDWELVSGRIKPKCYVDFQNGQ